VRILLDSHAFVWFLTGNTSLSSPAREAILAEDATVYVSAASAWEIATKVRAGKWAEAEPIAHDLEGVLTEHDFTPLAVTVEHGRLAGFLPGAHRDPFDRMLAAQAITEDMPLVTVDPAFKSFDVRVLW
jgi:PIN domain nuclease of toxin-antitoxin system